MEGHNLKHYEKQNPQSNPTKQNTALLLQSLSVFCELETLLSRVLSQDFGMLLGFVKDVLV